MVAAPSRRLWCALAGCGLVACAEVPKRMVLPEEMRPIAPTAGEASKPSPTGRSVMRVAESGRVWELELPQDGGNYELRVPLTGRPPEMLTRADQELLSKSKDRPAGAVDAKTVAAQTSLLTGLAKVTELYRDRRYELALIEVSDLETSYPNEARIHAMKGSLYKHLGKADLARASYKRALALDPADLAVAEALRESGEEQ